MPEQERRRRETVRLQAAAWFEEGLPQAEVARRLGVSRQAVHMWHRRWKSGGMDALRSSGPSGYQPLVSDAEFAVVAAALRAGPEAHGFSGQNWTLARIREVIADTTGVVYATPAGVWKLLDRHGWSLRMLRRDPPEGAEEKHPVPTWQREIGLQEMPGDDTTPP
ncbi:winged helix-turn-helix domain-containing protein [Streptomyces puniciscabiei]